MTEIRLIVFHLRVRVNLRLCGGSSPLLPERRLIEFNQGATYEMFLVENRLSVCVQIRCRIPWADANEGGGGHELISRLNVPLVCEGV